MDKVFHENVPDLKDMSICVNKLIRLLSIGGYFVVSAATLHIIPP